MMLSSNSDKILGTSAVKNKKSKKVKTRNMAASVDFSESGIMADLNMLQNQSNLIMNNGNV